MAGQPQRATIYFLTDDRTAPLGVRRALLRRPGALTARLALEQLLAGPTADERAAGLTTAVPEGARIRTLRVEMRATGSDAFVDLSGLPSADDADAVLKVRVMTQVARTLIGLSDIARVWLRVDGRAWGLWDQQGNIRDDPIDYERLRGFFHICTAKPGTETVPAECFTALP
jgi:spore germination protein GerM